jgi:integrase
MPSIYERKDSPFLWLKFRDAAGRLRQEKTKFLKGDPAQREQAQRLLDVLERRVEAEREAAGGQVLTVAIWAERWLEARRQRGVSAVDGDRASLVRVLARLGELPLKDVRIADVRETFAGIMASGELAPKSIHNVYGTTKTMFTDAVAKEHIPANPCVLLQRRGELPEREDRNPTWRRQAIFGLPEIGSIITSPSIPAERRVLYALVFLTGERIGEAAARTWSDLDQQAGPLACLVVGTSWRTKARRVVPVKTRKVRWVPVHPLLAELLAEWQRAGWARTFGRTPRAEDLIAPEPLRAEELAQLARQRTPTPDLVRTRSAPAAGQPEAYRHWPNHAAYKRLQDDLEQLGLRGRRVHDFRRTFVSNLRAAGADEGTVQLITHGPRKSVMSDYTTLPWAAMCSAVERLRFDAASRMVVLPGYGLATTGATPRIPGAMQVGAAGFEPSSVGHRRVATAREGSAVGSGSAGLGADVGGDRSQSATASEEGSDEPPSTEPDPSGYLAHARRIGLRLVGGSR